MFQMTHTGRARRLLAGAVLLLAAASARAACYLTVDPLPFGTYQAAQGTSLDASFNVAYRCDFGNFTANYSFSAGGSGNVNARAMSRGTSRLQYQLYSDAARTQVLTTGSTFLFLNRTITYYARVAANQDVAPGSYSDTIIVTVTP